MNFLKKTSVFLTLLAAVAVSIYTASPVVISHAQIPTSITGVEINVDPETPQPGQIVTVEVKSYVTDLNAAKIAWYANQKQVATGVGKTKYSFTAAQNGVKTTIAAYIVTVEGREVQKSVMIQPNAVDLVTETGGYIPPFYLGKPIVSYQNRVKIIAMPHLISSAGAEIDPKKLVYTWKRDSKVLQDQSGFGKQSVTVTGNIVPRPYTISVDVSSSDGKTHGAAELGFEETSPSVLFYENDPLYGTLYNVAIGNRFRMRHGELGIVAAPFGFNTEDGTSVSYAWSVNSNERPDLGNGRTVTLRVKEGAEGSSGVSLDIRNEESILQGASGSFTAYFSNKANSGGDAGTGTGSNTFTNPF